MMNAVAIKLFFNEFCYQGYVLKNDGNYKKDNHQRRNEDLHAEVDVVYRPMTHGRYLTPPSKVAAKNRLCLFGHNTKEHNNNRLLQQDRYAKWKEKITLEGVFILCDNEGIRHLPRLPAHRSRMTFWMKIT
ncbi:hypothetical protein RB195_001135 [Necator americanus]|uniref:PiggyBac transposable element-derived protein domain-containing protein n=1 Tax=Necator americanus TaxID=51031 RepID=A0ABR1DFV3_NECAM